MPYVNQRWLGGMLTNFATVSGRVKRMQELRAMQTAGDFDAMPKKEALRHVRELEKLQRNLGGISRLDRLPDAVFVIDTKKEHIAVTEANKLNMPVVAVVDTNCDPDVITYVIPGNDDAIRSGTLMCRIIADAVMEGRFVYAHRAAARQAAAAEAAPPTRTGPRPTPPGRAGSRAGGRDGRARRAPARSRPAPTSRPPRWSSPDDRPSGRRDRGTGRRGGLSMADFTAKDVQALRRMTGAGMLDAKRALEENDGDTEAAARWLREKGLADMAKRADRQASEGAVGVVREDSVAAIVELTCETDFVAKAAGFVALVDDLAALVAAKGEAAVAERQSEVAQLATSLKENISVGRVVRLEAGPDEVVDTYLHTQDGRGRTPWPWCCAAGPMSWPTTSPSTSPSPAPHTCAGRTCPRTRWPQERATVETISRNEGKPEAAMAKIVEGRMNGWFKERVLLEQSYVHDEKQTIAALLGPAEIVSFAQVVVGS